MNAQSKKILEDAGLKNPRDVAMVEAIVVAQRSPTVLIVLVASLVLNLILATVLFRASMGLGNAEDRMVAAAANLSSAAAALSKEGTTASVALSRSAEINQNAANVLLANAQSLPALVSTLNETARSIERSDASLKLAIENANRQK